jgi:hypothetical protein
VKEREARGWLSGGRGEALCNEQGSIISWCGWGIATCCPSLLGLSGLSCQWRGKTRLSSGDETGRMVIFGISKLICGMDLGVLLCCCCCCCCCCHRKVGGTVGGAGVGWPGASEGSLSGIEESVQVKAEAATCEMMSAFGGF